MGKRWLAKDTDMWNPVKEAEKAAKKAVNKVIDPAVNGAKHGINGLANDAKRSINQVTRDAKSEISTTARQAEEGITRKLPELAEEAVHQAVSTVLSASTGKGLDMALDVIELLAPDTFKLFIGLELALVVQVECQIGITIPNPVAKLTEIRKWAKRPPKGRTQIIACCKDFGPQSLSVSAGVSGTGGECEFSGDTKYDKLDAFLAKRGVA